MLYLSLLIRLWREPSLEAKASAPHWHAELEHIQSGQRWAFNSLDELLEFMRQQVDGLAQGAVGTGSPLSPPKKQRRNQQKEQV